MTQPEPFSDPTAGFAQVVFRPVGGLLTAGFQDAAVLLLVGKIPAEEADLVFVQQFHPFVCLPEIIPAVPGGVAHAEFADKHRKSVCYTGFQTTAQVVGMGGGIARELSDGRPPESKPSDAAEPVVREPDVDESASGQPA